MSDHAKLPKVHVLYHDAELLIVDKPAGVAVKREGDRPTVADLLPQSRLPGPTPRAVLYLEPWASGIAVLARTVPLAQSIRAQFERGESECRYLALAGGFVAGDGLIDVPLQAGVQGDNTRPSRRRGKPAETRYVIRERLAGNTLLECIPQGYLRHQIRAHLASIGHPLTVDPKYGGGTEVMLSTYKGNYRPSRRREEQPLIKRLTLHAESVRLRHAGTAQELTFTTPPPKDFRATVNQLSRLA